MLESNGLLNSKDEALVEMSYLLSEMMNELKHTQVRVDRLIDSGDQVPINHGLSLKNNDDFYKPYTEYHQLILDNL